MCTGHCTCRSSERRRLGGGSGLFCANSFILSFVETQHVAPQIFHICTMLLIKKILKFLDFTFNHPVTLPPPPESFLGLLATYIDIYVGNVGRGRSSGGARNFFWVVLNLFFLFWVVLNLIYNQKFKR